ncbi:putative reverse transcriptase zinc-binding domain-containing protein [Helianthus anomalus]
MHVRLNQNQDKWEWIGAADKDFSTNAMKRLLDSNRIGSVVYVSEECRWIPKKCNISIWRAELGKIAMMDELRKRNVGDGNSVCSLCEEVDESIEHIFTNFFFASMLWSFISSWCKCQNFVVFSFRDLIEAHDHVGLSGQKKEVVKGLNQNWLLEHLENEV